MRRSIEFLRHEGGAAAAEFALVVPALILVIFGMIDVGGYAWRMNMAQKASQFGARVAAVTDPVAPGLATENYVGTKYGLVQGQTIPASALGLISCTSTACSCTGTCPDTVSFDANAFNRIVARMRGIEPELTAGNVTIEYRGSGLGYAGDPYGMEISPLVTVRISDENQAAWEYQPWVGMIFNGGIDLPQVSYTLTMEDGAGTRSN